jgi:hypothetical protein
MFAPVLILTNLWAINLLTDLQADLHFGYAQTEQVILDRPDMGAIIQTETELRRMLELSFSGELSGRRVYWDCREPTSGRPAEHLKSDSQYPAMVRVSNVFSCSAEDKCTMLLVELNNLPLDKEFQLLSGAGSVKRKRRGEFVMSCIRHEFDAIKKTQLFFKKHPLATASSENSPYYSRLIAYPGDFSDYLRWIDALDSKAYNPRQYFGRVYDKTTFNFPLEHTSDSDSLEFINGSGHSTSSKRE